ncbi:IS110 family transposase [Paenibacillus sp. FSL H7-0331]|uniref:IS110 family transposase n=1 Tax=Paenibacillus sp. FSL H7-0331 TaxID=1920421 RepID=UPI002116D929|nr:IS110 family transposase [Paenibacillus sp. FSL H7-0331]
MNPVIGLDISKGESHGQAFLERGKPYRGTFQFEHTHEGLSKLLQTVHDVEHTSGQRPLLVLEATGHYQSPVVQFLLKSRLRKVKTDAADAYLLGELYYKEEFEPFKKRGVQLLNLRYLTRQYESLSKMCVQTKLQFQAVLDQVFPASKVSSGLCILAFHFDF